MIKLSSFYKDRKLYGISVGNYLHTSRSSTKFILALLLASSQLNTAKSAEAILEKTPTELKEKQTRQITGRVLSPQGTPVQQATVSAKTPTGGSTATDENGEFSLTVGGEETAIIISSVGFATEEIALSQRTTYNITLQEAIGNLDEVVVVGYGTQRKAVVTGSVAQVKGDDLKKAPVANVTNALVGRLPGLRATQRSGQPGADGSGIDIRGFGSALVIVDGIPGTLDQLDPNEIETMSIVKDASASVFGVRAANGVVLITTKSGTVGKPRINYSTYFGSQTINRFPELGDAALYAELSNEAAMNAWDIAGRNSQLSLPFSPEQLEGYRNGTLPSYNWFDEAIRRTSPQSYHNINVSGGSEDVKYFMILGTVNQEGMWRSEATNFKRYNVRANVEAKIANGLTAQMNLMGRRGYTNNPSTSTPILMAGLYRTFPTYPFYANDNPNYHGIHNNASQNTLALTDTDLTGYNRHIKSEFNGIFSLKYDIPGIEGLNAKANYAYNYVLHNNKTYHKKYDLYNYNGDTDQYVVGFTGNTPSNLSESNYFDENRTFQFSINYNKRFNDVHNVGGMLLFESQEGIGNSLSAYRQFLLDGVDELFAGIGQNQSNGGSSYETARNGYVGRFNYDYDGKYLAEFAFRYDGTYKVKRGSRYGFFPNVSLGWVLSRESFMSNLNNLDQLKIRASYGKVGDDEDIQAFQYLMGYTYPAANWVFGDQPIPGLIDRGMINELLTWYNSKTANLGVDFSLWQGKLSGEIDVFYRKRDGLLASRLLSLPNTFGANLPQENLNTDNNRGFEIALNHQNTIGELTYSVAPNFSWARRQYGYIERAESTNLNHNWRNNFTNRWDNIYWGYVSDGQFQNQEEINTAPIHDDQANKTLLPGDIRYVDLNNDGIIDDQDQQVIGRGTTPEIFYGLNLAAAYKGFDFSVLFQGASNFNAYFSSELQNPLFNNASAYAMFADRWHRADLNDPDSEWVAGKYPSTITSGANNNKRVSDFWLKDASYLRLKTLEFGYTFNQDWVSRAKIRNLRVFVSGQNLFTWDKIKYIDPEAPEGRGDYYPHQRVWTAGLNIGF